MRSYRPEELFDERGALRAELAALAPQGERRMGANPHANGGVLLRDLELPDFREYAVEVPAPTASVSEPTRVLGEFLRDVIRLNPDSFRIVGPDETASNRLGAVFEVTDRAWDAETLPERRSPGTRRAGHGGPLRASVPGLAGGLSADRPPRAVQQLRGVHPHRRLDVQPAREVAEGDTRDPLAAADRIAELPALLARLAPGPQRLLPSGPRIHRPCGQQEGGDRARLPAAGRQLPAVGRRPLPAQPRLRQRDRRRQAAVAQLPDDGGGGRALHPRDRHLGLVLERRRSRSPTWSSAARGRSDARERRGGGDPARASPRAEGTGRERRRPDAPGARQRASPRALRAGVRRAVHDRPAGDLRLPRLPVADPPSHLPAHQPRQHPRARLQGGGHHHDARSTW